jgi:hypothetical protein
MEHKMNGRDKPDHGGTLNVIFHGGITIYEGEDPEVKDRGFFEALLPKNDPEKDRGKRKSDRHVYRAGNWLGETEIYPGIYELRGADPGQASFYDKDEKAYFTLRAAGRPDPLQARVTIRFPRPHAIASLRIARVPLNAFDDDDVARLNLKTDLLIPNVHVFTYSFDDDNELKLANAEDHGDGHFWEPAFTGSYINLHIFCSEDRFSTPTQAAHDFDECVRLLGLRLRLEHPQPSAAAADDRDLPDGVLAEELEDLPFRTLRMARLGRLFREDGDTNLAWAANDPLGDPETCSNVRGGH